MGVTAQLGVVSRPLICPTQTFQGDQTVLPSQPYSWENSSRIVCFGILGLSASSNLNGKSKWLSGYISQFEIEHMARYSMTGNEGEGRVVKIPDFSRNGVRRVGLSKGQIS